MLKSEAQPKPRSIEELLGVELFARLDRLDVSSRKIFAGKLRGERRSKRKGESVEFADHRPYVHGDDLRFIDWNIYGRLDRLFMKLFLEEEDLALHVVLDASASMASGEPEKFRFAQRLSAALAYIGMTNLNRVSVWAMGGEDADAPVRTLRNLRGRRRVRDLGAFLCDLEAGGRTNFEEAAKRVALSRGGKGVTIIISDFLFPEGFERGLRHLVGRGYDLFAIQTLSPQEIDPPLGGDLRLKDVETGDMAEVTISAPLLERYRQNLAAHEESLRAFLAKRDATLVPVSTEADVEDLVFQTLRERGLVR